MPRGRKRAANDSSGRTTRAKAAKTEAETTPGTKASTQESQKISASAAAFKADALPLHVNITHTPPVVGDDDTVDVAQTDPGFIGSTALLPSTDDGEYGWKGSKQAVIEVPDGKSGKTRKVKVMLTINATVLDTETEDPGSEPQEVTGDNPEAGVSDPQHTTD